MQDQLDHLVLLHRTDYND